MVLISLLMTLMWTDCGQCLILDNGIQCLSSSGGDGPIPTLWRSSVCIPLRGYSGEAGCDQPLHDADNQGH